MGTSALLLLLDTLSSLVRIEKRISLPIEFLHDSGIAACSQISISDRFLTKVIPGPFRTKMIALHAFGHVMNARL